MNDSNKTLCDQGRCRNSAWTVSFDPFIEKLYGREAAVQMGLGNYCRNCFERRRDERPDQ